WATTPLFTRAMCDQLPVSEAVRQVGLDDLGVRLGHHLGAALLADVLAVVADQPVALARDAGLQLAGRSQLEALLGARFGLQFRHFSRGAWPRPLAISRAALACLQPGASEG